MIPGCIMGWIIRNLIERLVWKGMEITAIPSYIKSLANTMISDENLSLQELNTRLETLGWDDFELDHQTFQLIMVIFENYGVKSSDIEEALWFENCFDSEEILPVCSSNN